MNASSPLKILAVSEFDPAGVLVGHRRALRALGVDYRLAVKDIYRADAEVDWQLGAVGNIDELVAFAKEADVVQFNPVIGQPWSYHDTTTVVTPEADVGKFGPVDWSTVPLRGVRVAFFHGSRNAAANAAAYAQAYRSQGYSLLTSTLDYAEWLDATFVPSIVYLPEDKRAKLRSPGEPLLVVHSPSDPEFCNTREFLDVAARAGAIVIFKHRRPHAEVLDAKLKASAGFDHLRGAFSVNTIENALLGLVPLVGWNPRFMRHWPSVLGPTPPWPQLENSGELKDWLKLLCKSVEHTRALQNDAWSWARGVWAPDRLAAYIVSVYRRIVDAR